MNLQQFWTLIEKAHQDAPRSMDDKCARITFLLGKLSAEDATDFSAHFEDQMARAYSWRLWGAAFVINGGCGDDSFSDFRASLISQGQQLFEGALSDPDSLAAIDIPEDEWTYEGFAYAIADGVEAAGGECAPGTGVADPSGLAWTEDEVYSQYPKLAAKYA